MDETGRLFAEVAKRALLRGGVEISDAAKWHKQLCEIAAVEIDGKTFRSAGRDTWPARLVDLAKE